MQLILMIRHGEPDLSAGSVDPPLSKQGLRQAEETAARLSQEPLDALFSSPLLRARQTLDPLAQKLGLTPEIVEGVAEIDYWGGRYLSLEELRKAGGAAWEDFLRDPFGTLGGDEKAFLETVANAMKGLTQRGGKRVAVATHGFPINAMLSETMNMHGLTNFTPHHGSVTRLHVDNAGQLRVLSINEMTHITRDAH
tara:strand:+ start:2404 stop:2991 length:588 start_codon:yes stop_codon:yes gene_type:complete